MIYAQNLTCSYRYELTNTNVIIGLFTRNGVSQFLGLVPVQQSHLGVNVGEAKVPGTGGKDAEALQSAVGDLGHESHAPANRFEDFH